LASGGDVRFLFSRYMEDCFLGCKNNFVFLCADVAVDRREPSGFRPRHRCPECVRHGVAGKLGGRYRISGNPMSLDPNRLTLTGENPFIRLSDTDGGAITTNASFWRILISPAGAGHVLT
jgi:hypothetical protein